MPRDDDWSQGRYRDHSTRSWVPHDPVRNRFWQRLRESPAAYLDTGAETAGKGDHDAHDSTDASGERQLIGVCPGVGGRRRGERVGGNIPQASDSAIEGLLARGNWVVPSTRIYRGN